MSWITNEMPEVGRPVFVCVKFYDWTATIIGYRFDEMWRDMADNGLTAEVLGWQPITYPLPMPFDDETAREIARRLS